MPYSMEGPAAASTPRAGNQVLPADVTGLLGSNGTGGSSLPMWLKPELFLAPGFDPEGCVADLRRFAPLSTLQSELQAYLATLKSKMVEVINEDYQDYVNLSAKLVNVDGAVLRMRKPLLELKDKLGLLCEAVRSELAALAAGLRRRKEVSLARSLLELMQELAHVASKVEKLLLEVGSAADLGAAGDLDARARLLERVAGEVSRLSFQANRGKDLAFVRAMEPRISAARAQLLDALQVALRAALEQRAHEPALHCMHAYTELGAHEPVEEALRRVLVEPVVTKLLQQHKSTHTFKAAAAAHAGGGESALSQLLRSIEAAVVQELGPLLEAALVPQSPLRVLDLLGSVVLAAVDAGLASTLPAVFSPGVPHAFHENYLAAQAFLEALEARCQGRSSLDRLRGSPAYAQFTRRWNTSVYFSLFFQEVAGELEDAVNQGRPAELSPAAGPTAQPKEGNGATTAAAAGGAVLPVSVAVIKGLTRTASSDVFLAPLADRFLRLALQLGQRYLHWATAACAARKSAPAAHPHTGQALPPGAAHPHPASHRSSSSSGAVLEEAALHPDSGLGSPTGSSGAISGHGGSGAAGSGNLAWVASLSLDDLSVLYSDMAAVAAHIRDTLAPQLLQRLHQVLPEEGRQAVQAGLAELADAIEAQGACVLGLMCDEVSEACVEKNLARQVKGITATYRMTTKGPPTRYSHYVTGVLAPLRGLLEGPRVSHLPPQAKQQVAHTVVDAVTARYQALAEDLLNAVRKTESTLKRLKKVQQQDAGDSGMSDSDKITLQLYLDVQEHAQQAARFHLHAPSLPSFQRLVDAVTPPPHVLAAASSNAANSNTLADPAQGQQ